MKWRITSIPALSVPLSVSVFILYLLTLAPGMLGGDAGELQFVPAILGLPHPTGTPLYVLLGKAWSLIPLGPTVAYRMNLLAAVSAALAIVLLFRLVHELIGHAIPALCAALFLAVSTTFWEQAIIADKYAFNALMVTLLLSLALKCGKAHSLTLPLTLAFTYGLSLTHHRSMLLFAPPLLIYGWWYQRSALWSNWRRLLRLVFLCLVPLLLYLYLPWAEARNLPPGTWHPRTLSDWLVYLRDAGFTSLVSLDSRDLGTRLAAYLQVMARDFEWGGAVLGIIGVAWLLLRRHAEAIFLIVAFLIQAVLAANYHVPRVHVFFLPSQIIYAIWIGCGLGVIWREIERWTTGRSRWLILTTLGVVATVMLLWPLLTLPARYRPLRESHLGAGVLDSWRQTLKSGQMADRLGRAIEDVIPQAVIVSDWEQATPLWYVQQIDGLRPDVQIVYPIERLDEAATWGRPLYLARTVDGVAKRWHPSSVGPLVALQERPTFTLPQNGLQVGLNFSDTIELTMARYETSTLRPGQVVPVTLYWRALQKPSLDYAVSLRLLDEAGETIYQIDNHHPVLGMAPTSHWESGEVIGDYYEIQIPPELTSGIYRWGVLLYHSLPDGRWENLKIIGADSDLGIGGNIQITR